MPFLLYVKRLCFLAACLFSLLSLRAQSPERRQAPSPEEVQKIKTQIEEELKTATSDTAKVRLQMQLASLVSRENFNEGLLLAKSAVALAEKTGHTETIARCYFAIGNIYSGNDRYDNALEYFNKGLPLAEKTGKPVLQEGYYKSLAQIYFNRGVYEKALDFYQKSFGALKKMQAPPARKATTLAQIGNVFYNTQKHREAINTFKQALGFAEQAQDWRLAGSMWQNIGNNYSALGEKEAAEQAQSKAQELWDRDKKKVSSPANNKSGNK